MTHQGAELVQDRTERPDIRLERVVQVLHQLRGHVQRRANGGAREVPLVGAHGFREAEIAELEEEAAREARVLEEQDVL